MNEDGARLVILRAAANESAQILTAVSKFPKVRRQPGPPKQRFDELYPDRGYDCDATRDILRWLGIRPKIARRGEEHGSGLGRVRWVVERTISWLKGMRRLRTRYDRRLVIQGAWNSLAAAVICLQLATEAPQCLKRTVLLGPLCINRAAATKERILPTPSALQKARRPAAFFVNLEA